MKCVIENYEARLSGPFDLNSVQAISTLSGRKHWHGAGGCTVEASAANIRLLKELLPGIEFEDQTGDLAALEELMALPSQHVAVAMADVDYKPARPLAEFQEKVLAISWERKAYALLLDCGCRKTATTIANAGMLHATGRLTGVLIFAPKGVHEQWIEEALPADIGIRAATFVWKGKTIDFEKYRHGPLEFLAMNLEAARTPKGYAAAEAFLARHKRRNMIVVDESHRIKNHDGKMTRAFWQLAELSEYRRILTGTLIARGIEDAWAQFKFLDERILGHPYVTSFKHRFCIFRPGTRQVVAAKNIEEFYALIAPHSFRATKDELLGLPEKIYDTRVYEMGEKTRFHYDELRETFMTQLDSGAVVDVQNGLSMLMRLQQVICGYLPHEDGTYETIETERIEVLTDLVRMLSGSMVIWARFTEDIARIIGALEKEYGKGCAVHYYGATTDAERRAHKAAYIGRQARFFVANQATGGTGLDGLQAVTENVIYYSNSFNYVDRKQSEDRTHRDGTIGHVGYFDLIARRSVDTSIRSNLSRKRDLAALTLDDIRRAISSE